LIIRYKVVPPSKIINIKLTIFVNNRITEFSLGYLVKNIHKTLIINNIPAKSTVYIFEVA
jgi:hypothetical protein